MTPHGFINDDDKALKEYKKDHIEDWKRILGGEDFNIIEDDSSGVGIETFTEEPQ